MTQTTLYLDPSWRVDKNDEMRRPADAGDLKALMDEAGRFLSSVKAMRAHDPVAASILSRLGGMVMHRSQMALGQDVHPDFLASSPFFASVFFIGEMEEGEAEIKSLGIAAMRIDRPVNVQPHNGPIYKITGIWKARNLGSVAPVGYAGVNADGTVRALKELLPVRQVVGTGGTRKTIWHMKWRNSPLFEENAALRGCSLDESAQRYLAVLSSMIEPDRAIWVRARKGRDAISFYMATNGASRVFGDRDLLDDRRRPILHYVRGHYRESSNGGETFVRPHYRGERSFTRRGIRFDLSVPGWHHGAVLKAGLSAIQDRQSNEPVVSGAQMAKKMNDATKSPFFLSRSSYRAKGARL